MHMLSVPFTSLEHQCQVCFCQVCFCQVCLAQLVESRTCMQKVSCSIPGASKIFYFFLTKPYLLGRVAGACKCQTGVFVYFLQFNVAKTMPYGL